MCVSVGGQTWKMHTPFKMTENMAETRDRVYFMSLGSLYGYDHRDGELIMFNDLNTLNDVDITGIFAPWNGTRLAVAYSSGNIDIINDNGNIINLPDIKDATLDSRIVNSIAFSDDGKEMLVGTNFGVVRYNLSKMEVKDSGNFGVKVDKVAFSGSNPVMWTDSVLYILPSAGNLRNKSSWTELGHFDLGDLVNANGNLYALVNEAQGTFPVVFTDMSSQPTLAYTRLTTSPAVRIVSGTSTSPIFVQGGNVINEIGSDNRIQATYTMPDSYSKRLFTATGGAGDLWFAQWAGINNADLTSAEPYFASLISPGVFSVKNVNFMRQMPSKNIFIANKGNSVVFSNSGTWIDASLMLIVPGGKMTDITPQSLTLYQDPEDTYNRIYDLLFVRENEKDPSTYYIGDLHQGFFKMSLSDNRELAHYSPLNSPLKELSGVRAMDAVFDANGYLWVLSETAKTNPTLMALSPEGQEKNNDVSVNDWHVAATSTGFNTGRDGKLITTADKKVIFAKGFNSIFVYDTKGTPDFSDDETAEITTWNMADGSGFASYSTLTNIALDASTGALWLSTDAGVFYIPKPTQITNGSVDIVKPKVARNDGTNLADYLLSTQYVYTLDVADDRTKWFVTEQSGIFHTNADGTQILANYNTSNSPLPSNSVYAVVADKANSGKVYFGTSYGLVEYLSDEVYGTKEYDNVKIYPNPVKPDYAGGVTIEGLVPGSRVNIVSSGGSLVARLESEGGKAFWSANGAGGQRVPAGVYHVLASSADNSGKPVGKILVIR